MGVAWVIVLLARDFGAVRTDFQIASYAWLLATVLIGVVALLLLVPVFQSLLVVHSDQRIRYVQAARMLFVAQILRHLPGRIWGIVYLVAETRREIPSAAMVRANLDTMFYAVFFILLVAASLLIGVYSGVPLAVACYAVGSVLLGVSIRFDILGHCIATLTRLIPRLAEKLEQQLPAQRKIPWSVAVRIVACTGLSWVCYLSVWAVFPWIFPILQDVNIWLLCASYSAAWFIGYVSMITPSGLGVREASFFAFASALTTMPNLAFLAVFVRVWQLAAEVIVFLMFAFFGTRPSPKDE
jgi:uncharacterized membrane protein YbhN (UPF0104 family)